MKSQKIRKDVQFIRPPNRDVPPEPQSPLWLFNIQMVDFVRVDKKTGVITPVEWPSQATHHLQPTSWNTLDRVDVSSRGKAVIPNGKCAYALSVCLMPMKPVRKQYKLQARAKLNPEMPAYIPTLPLARKRVVLAQLFQLCDVPKKYSKALKTARNDECDGFYKAIVQSSKEL
jgi:hypothetical protein